MTDPATSPLFVDFCSWVVQHGQVSCRENELVLDIAHDHPCLSVVLGEMGSHAQRTPRGGWSVSGTEVMDLLCQLVESADFRDVFAGSDLKRQIHWATQVLPMPSAGAEIKVQLIDERAVVPHKQRASDSGYDLTLIAERKRVGAVRLYGTGLIVDPPAGYYFDVVARSSIIKTGHMLANNVGIIDRAYRGELMVPLIRVDPAAPDLELPNRLAQLIPRPIVHFRVSVQSSLTSTSRGAGGFGSSG